MTHAVAVLTGVDLPGAREVELQREAIAREHASDVVGLGGIDRQLVGRRAFIHAADDGREGRAEQDSGEELVHARVETRPYRA